MKNRYVPNPRTIYLCPYCNEAVCLIDQNAVVDSWQNVCHLVCFDKECSYLLVGLEKP